MGSGGGINARQKFVYADPPLSKKSFDDETQIKLNMAKSLALHYHEYHG